MLEAVEWSGKGSSLLWSPWLGVVVDTAFVASVGYCCLPAVSSSVVSIHVLYAAEMKVNVYHASPAIVLSYSAFAAL